MYRRTLSLIAILVLSLSGTAWAVDLNKITEVTSLESAFETRNERLDRVVIAKACQSTLSYSEGLATKEEDPGLVEVLAKLEAVRRFKELRCPQQTYTQNDLLTQIKLFLERPTIQTLVGSTIDDLEILGVVRHGEYDVALRGLVRILFQYGDLLPPGLYDYVLTNKLKAFGGGRQSDELIDKVQGVPQIPETENHILMTQSARYLINQLVLRRDGYRPEWDNRTNGMKALMLERLQRILTNDFEEYNSRPYQRYSLVAIENLHDFAEDLEVQLAARLVLDYVSAKYAVSNNNLRRVVPFRRRSEKVFDKENGHELFEGERLFGGDSDEVTGFFLMESGLAQALPPGKVVDPFVGTMLMSGVSGYRVPDLVQDLIVNHAHRNFYQRIHHDGAEIYASSQKYLISGGGIWTEPRKNVKILGQTIDKAVDRGVALATTLIPTANPGINWGTDFIRLDGLGGRNTGGFVVNTCVAPGFACGMNPVIPTKYHALHLVRSQGPWQFVNMRGEGLYVALYKGACKDDKDSNFCEDVAGSGELTSMRQNESFGFFEVVPSPAVRDIEEDVRRFDEFVNAVLAKNGSKKFTASGSALPKGATINVYDTLDGRRIEFRPISNDLGFNQDGRYDWGIVSIDGWRPERNITKWPLAEGTVINSHEKTGYIEIRNPALDQTLILDFANTYHPRRVLLDPPRAMPAAAAVKAVRASPGPNIPGHNVLFTVRQQGVQGTWAEASTNWQWTKPWGPISDSPLWINSCSKVTALSRTNSALNLFGIGDDKRVYGTWWAPGGKWQDWTVIGQHQADSLVTAVESRQGQVDLFMIGPDRGIYTTYFGLYEKPLLEGLFENQELEYTGAKRPDLTNIIGGRGLEESAERITPEAPAPPGAPAPEAQSRGSLPIIRPGSPALQVPPSGPKLQLPPLPTPTMAPTCKSKDIPCWGAWRRIGNQVAAPGSQVTAVVSRPGLIWLFVVGTDKGVYTTWWDKEKGWRDWSRLVPLTVSPSAQVTAISSDDGRIDLFVVAENRRIYTNSWERNDWRYWGWQGWTPVGALTVPPTSQISALIPRNSHLDLFVVGDDLRVYSTYREFPARKELGLPASKWRDGEDWFPIHNWKATRNSQVVSLLPRDGHIDLFAMGADGVITTTSWEPTPGWQLWQVAGTKLGERKLCPADLLDSGVMGASPNVQLELPRNEASPNLQLPPNTLGQPGATPPQQTVMAQPGATTAPQQAIAGQATGLGTQARIVGPNPGSSSYLYGILPDGVLKWFRHNGVERKEGPGGIGPNDVGTGWQAFKQVIPSGGTTIYGLAPDGVLKWYSHTGSPDGTVTWSGPKDVGIGWQNFKQVFSGSDGILYAIAPDGNLLWYRHNGFKEGTGLSTPGAWTGPKSVGVGWQNFKHVFGGCNGVIYAITPDGTLKWYKHTGYPDGSPTWQGPTTVGSGWQNFTQVFGACDGKIYALQPNGTLKLHRHTGFATGQPTWEGPTDAGTGFPNFLTMFALLPSGR